MIYQFGILFLLGTCMSLGSLQPRLCICTLEYSPICGTDGVTYPNKCSFECDHVKVTMAYRGECRAKREAKPVCGTDGHTYNNSCMLNCAKEDSKDLEIDHVGKCATEKRKVSDQLRPCPCATNLRPVCASNGVTYSNECVMQCAGAELIVAKNGLCDKI